MGLKAKCLFGIFQKNCSSGVSHVIVCCLLITISSSARLSYRCLDLFLFQTWAYFVCLIPVLCWPYMIWFLGLKNFFLSNWGNGHCRKWCWLYYPCLRLPNVKMAAPYVYAVSIIITDPWGYQLYSNCLPTMLNTAQLFASTAEHGPTICQSLVTSIIRLNPSSFLGFCFPFKIVCFCVFCFSQVVSWELCISDR